MDLNDTRVTLTVGARQKVEILKALYRGVDILILDEPTTNLTPLESWCIICLVESNGWTKALAIFLSPTNYVKY